MILELNELETKRFGIVAAHVGNPETPLSMIDLEADALQVEMLTVRIDVGDLSLVHGYEAAGFQLMDTLMYYGRNLSDVAPPPASGNTTIRFAESSDAEQIASLASVGFRGYVGHFHVDPRLEEKDADAAYIEWAEKSVETLSANTPILVASNDDVVTGFLTLSGYEEEVAHLVLSAVDTTQQGRGVYRALISHALHEAALAGCERVSTSTQINNYAVQRVWARQGLLHERSVYTLHKWYDRESK